MSTYHYPARSSDEVSKAGVFLVRLVALALLLLSWVLASSAFAQPRGARLSSDLQAYIASGQTGAVRVIVSGDLATLRGVAGRHGLAIGRALKAGIVVKATPAQIAALQDDPGVQGLAADTLVAPTMAVTDVATGADQAWAGIAGRAGVTGRGVGVAVIDSGVTVHQALRGQVVASVDFTAEPGATTQDQ